MSPSVEWKPPSFFFFFFLFQQAILLRSESFSLLTSFHYQHLNISFNLNELPLEWCRIFYLDFCLLFMNFLYTSSIGLSSSLSSSFLSFFLSFFRSIGNASVSSYSAKVSYGVYIVIFDLLILKSILKLDSIRIFSLSVWEVFWDVMFEYIWSRLSPEFKAPSK